MSVHPRAICTGENREKKGEDKEWTDRESSLRATMLVVTFWFVLPEVNNPFVNPNSEATGRIRTCPDFEVEI